MRLKSIFRSSHLNFCNFPNLLEVAAWETKLNLFYDPISIQKFIDQTFSLMECLLDYQMHAIFCFVVNIFVAMVSNKLSDTCEVATRTYLQSLMLLRWSVMTNYVNIFSLSWKLCSHLDILLDNMNKLLPILAPPKHAYWAKSRSSGLLLRWKAYFQSSWNRIC